MGVDLLAGLGLQPLPPLGRAPRVLVFDSGLGGLTVLAELVKALQADFVYAADDAGFPYGALDDHRLVARVLAVMERLVAREAPDLVVVACNTASTLALPALRARFALPFVGTVPAIKPAVAASRSGLVTVLATPGTVRREHTRAMIDAFAGKAEVTLVGAQNLASYAEAELRGAPVDDAAIGAEIAPCFVESEGGARTDAVALACTHFPLLTRRFEAVAPWPVTWIDPAPAIARRAVALAGAQPAGEAPMRALFTSERALPQALAEALRARGIETIEREVFPLT